MKSCMTYVHFTIDVLTNPIVSCRFVAVFNSLVRGSWFDSRALKSHALSVSLTHFDAISRSRFGTFLRR